MPCDAPPAIVRIQDDHGGEIGRYLAQAGLFRACHARPRIGGACFSACTIYLGVPGACAEPTAVFGFHAAYYPGQFGAPPDALVAGATGRIPQGGLKWPSGHSHLRHNGTAPMRAARQAGR